MDLSVVIPTHNRAGLLPRTIPALLNQQANGFTYEVIFVSDGSNDGSEVMLQEAAARHPEKLRFIHIAGTGGPSAPRNAGIRAAIGESVIILDDDVLPDPDLVRRHGEFHRQYPEQHHAALGEVYVPPELLSDPMSMFHSFRFDELRRRERLSYLHFWACNVSVKRRFLIEAGMFDEKFLHNEDMLCGYRLIQRGMHFHFLPAARGQHLHQLKPSGIAAKGRFTGLWQYAFLQVVPDVDARRHFGVLTASPGLLYFCQRLLMRGAFRAFDNPLTMKVLRLCGAESGRRSRASDLYYYVIFRRNFLAGYYEAKRQAHAAARAAARTAAVEWVDRGE